MRAARSQEDALRDAAHDAFMAFWRAGEADEALWLAYCSAQARYDSYLIISVSSGPRTCVVMGSMGVSCDYDN